MSDMKEVYSGKNFGKNGFSGEKLKMLILDFILMTGLLILDQVTKYLALTRLKGTSGIVLIEGVLELQYVENTGMAFSLFQQKKVLILLLGFLLLAVILFVLFRLPEQKKFRVTHLLLAAVIAGALGNMIDRIRFDFVVDFIAFVLIDYPVFNVADCYIVVSAVVLFLIFMFVYKDEDLEFLSRKRKKAVE